MKYITKKYVISLVLIFIGAICFGFYLKNIKFDHIIMKFIQNNNFFVSNLFFLKLIKTITYIGNKKTYFFVLPLIFVYLYYKKLKKEIIILILAILFSYIMNEVIKHIVCRVRPKEFFVIYMKGYSFPSGHAMNMSSFYLTLGYILKEKLNIKYINCFLYILVFFVSCSRIILGVHWVSDVLVGLLLGVLISCMFIHLYNNYWRN